MRARKIATCDCETDPFLHERIPMPFVWGFYDGRDFLTFRETKDFIEHVIDLEIVLYAHNGGKFDFMYMLSFIGETKVQIINSRIVSMKLGKCELRDSFAAVPEALKNIKKKEIDYDRLERCNRENHWAEIIDYLEGDCVYLYELMHAYRKRAGVQKTIASNALAFCKKLGTDPGKTSYKFDSNFREYYFGGRTECFQPGTHKNITLLDIKSAYPYAMMHDHATGELPDFARTDTLEGLTREQIQRSFITVECNACGCFPLRAEAANGLIFPHEYNEYKVTGWEYLVAKDLNLISNETIRRVSYSEKTINFRPYVKYWYAEKLSHSAKDSAGNRLDPINYTIDKIMMNSLYGKLAQNVARYFDYRICKGGTEICDEYVVGNVKDTCSNCYARDLDHGWQHCLDFGKLEIHRRESLWRYRYLYGVQWEGKKLYKNVATGASITGFCRAYLLRAIHAIGLEHVIYTDTDSIICKAAANVAALAIGDEIGNWEREFTDAPIGYFNGKKLYGVLKKDGQHKLASKGAKLTFADMKALAQGETVTWKSPAPSFALLTGRIPPTETITSPIDSKKLFVVREIRRTSPA